MPERAVQPQPFDRMDSRLLHALSSFRRRDSKVRQELSTRHGRDKYSESRSGRTGLLIFEVRFPFPFHLPLWPRHLIVVVG